MTCFKCWVFPCQTAKCMVLDTLTFREKLIVDAKILLALQECDTFTRNSGEREQNELQWRTVKGKLSTKQGHKGQRAAPEIQFKRREKRKCSHQHEKPHSAMCAAGHRWSRLQQSIGPRMHVLLGQSSTGSTTPCVAGVVIHPGPWPPTAARCRTEPGCLQANSLVWNLWYTESAGPSPVLVSSPASESSGSAIGLHPNLVPCLSTSSLINVDKLMCLWLCNTVHTKYNEREDEDLVAG